MPTVKRITEHPDEVKRYRFKGAAGEYVYATDFDNAARCFLDAAERCLAAERREQALQMRLNAADQRIDDRSGTCEWSREDDSGIWHSGCGATWSFHDDGPEENGMHFCHSCGKTLVVEATASEPEPDDDWRMNPCKQGHRDVGAAGGVAHCYTCDEKITAATTQEAFEQWNAVHPASVQP